MSDEQKIDISNRHAVGCRGKNVVVVNPPREMSAEEAIVFAAWLVAMASFYSKLNFATVLERVEST